MISAQCMQMPPTDSQSLSCAPPAAVCCMQESTEQGVDNTPTIPGCGILAANHKIEPQWCHFPTYHTVHIVHETGAVAVGNECKAINSSMILAAVLLLQA